MITVTAIGNLTRDAEMKTFPSGDRGVIQMTIASNRQVREESQATFLDVKLFGKIERLQNVLPYLLKGTKIATTGDLVQENWVKTSASGETEKRSKLVLYTSTFEFVGGAKKDNVEQAQQAQQTQQAQQAQQTQQTQSQSEPEMPSVDIDDEEIPF